MYCDNFRCDCETETGILEGGLQFCGDECAAGGQTDQHQGCRCGHPGCAPEVALEDDEPVAGRSDRDSQ